MSVQVRRRRETAAFLSTFVGAQGELLVDTTNNRVQVHDGTTPGGFPAARLLDLPSSAAPLAIAQGGTGATTGGAALAALGAIGRTAVADATYNVLASDRTVAFTALSAARVATLPAAASFPPGTQLLVMDESGQCSATNTITLVRAGADTISGAASAVIAMAYGYVALASNGAGKWTIIDQSTGSLAQQPASNVAITGGAIDGTVVGQTTAASGKFTQVGFGSTIGTAGQPNKVTYFSTDYGVGVSPSSIDHCVGATAAFQSFYYQGSLKHRLGGAAGFTYLLSLDNTPIGATIRSTIACTTLDASGAVTLGSTLGLKSYTVATLPAPGTAGRTVHCANARMQTATAGTLEASGSGTGGLVTDNGTAWKIAGTNINVSA